MNADDRLRRALEEVAAKTEAADFPPPPLDDTVVRLADHRRPSRHRLVLGGVAAAVVVVAGLLAVLAGGDDGGRDDEVTVADDATTTTDDPQASSTTVDTTTSTTAVPSTTDATPSTVDTATTVPAEPAGPAIAEVVAAGDGWEVVLDGERCVAVVHARRSIVGRECDRDRDAWLLAAPLPDGRTVHVAGGRRVVSADGYTSAGIAADGDLALARDSGTGRYVVSDSVPYAVLLREGPGADWVAGIYDGRLVPIGGGLSSYQRATGSLSFGRYQEVGGYSGAGGRCALARQVTPEPAVIADVCLQDRVSAVLVPTQDPALFDLFGIATAVGEWRCELPAGGSCGSGPIAGIAGFAGIIAHPGPIAVGDAAEVVIAVDGGEVVVPVP